ncbi:MAG: guanylate kinase [Mariprofundales bacterium]|nr:guanylate kinase [Mariprofundales bacterium]
MSGRLFTISGPSGAGKSSLSSAWLERDANLKLSISCTTRAPRPGDVDGEHYHFLSGDEFREQIEQDAFLEWASVHGNYYGTRLCDVNRLMSGKNDVLLEIDWQGARQVAERVADLCRIFILPPSMAVLKQRLIARGHDSAEVMAARLAAAESEMEHADEADYQVINDDFDRALNTLLSLSSQ